MRARPASSALEAKKPNIVFILVDNLGYGELGVYGGGILRGAPTPRIDKLANEGTRLLNFNVDATVHPVSIRTHDGSLLHPLRYLRRTSRWKPTAYAMGDHNRGTLSGQGYATGMWGKWHLGSAEERFPTHQGFDEWYGIPRTYDEAFWPSLNEATGLWPSVGNKQGWNANIDSARAHLRSTQRREGPTS